MEMVHVKSSTVKELCLEAVAKMETYKTRMQEEFSRREKLCKEHISLEWEAEVEYYTELNKGLFYTVSFPEYDFLRIHRYYRNCYNNTIKEMDKKIDLCYTGDEVLVMTEEDYKFLISKGEKQLEWFEYWLSFEEKEFLYYHRNKLEEYLKEQKEKEEAKTKKKNMEESKLDREMEIARAKLEAIDKLQESVTKIAEITPKPKPPECLQDELIKMTSKEIWITLGGILILAAIVINAFI